MSGNEDNKTTEPINTIKIVNCIYYGLKNIDGNCHKHWTPAKNMELGDSKGDRRICGNCLIGADSIIELKNFPSTNDLIYVRQIVERIGNNDWSNLKTIDIENAQKILCEALKSVKESNLMEDEGTVE